MLKKTLRLLCIGFVCWLSTSITLASPHVVRNIGINEGLNDLLVNAFYEDPNGLIWFGTGSSLELFDGINLTHYPIPGEASQQQRVEAITGNTESIYFCNNQALYHLNRTTDELTTILDHQINGVIRDLCQLNNHLYIATSEGLYIYDIYARTVHHTLFNPIANDAPQNELRHLRADRHGNLWITSKAGLHALSRNGDISNYFYSDLPQGGFTELAITDSTIYLGSFHNGIYRFDIANACFTLVYRSVSPVVSLQCHNSLIMVATDGDGVFFLDPQSLVLNPLTSKLSSTSVYRAMIDSRGILWIGYYQHGLDYTLGQTEQFGLHRTDMLSTEGMAVRSVAIHGQQRLIGTRQGLYLVDKQRHITHRYTEASLGAKMIFATTFHRDRYYIGTYGGGLFTLDTLGQHLQPIHSPYIGQEIFSLATDSSDRLWVGSDIGVATLDGDRVVRHFSADNSILPPGLVYCIYFDRLQRGWLCTAGGIVLYDAVGDSLTTHSLPEDFPHTMMVRSIYSDRQNRLYFMPDKGETYIVDSTLAPISNIPMPKAENLFMIEDTTGQLWVGTKDGLYSLHNNQLHRYGFANGLPSAIFTLCQPAIDHEGTVWLGNSRGLIYLKPDSVNLLANTRSVLITRHERIDHALTISFSDLRYSDPGSACYEYMLKGEDDTWQTLRAQSRVHYPYLRAGRYTFHVRLAGEPDTETTLAIRVPISLRTWLLLLLLSLFLLSLYPLYRYYHARYRRIDVPSEEEHSEPMPEPVHNKYANVSISTEALDELHRQIDEIMLRDKIYLRADLKIAEIAHMVNVPAYQLSYLFTQHMQTTFYDYIYHYRIEEFKQRVRNGEIKRYTVESLAEQCGFNSRASFFRNFKKEVGMTPNEYIKTIKTTE